jgi:hypothetical protein
MLINASYFVGELNIPKVSNTDVSEKLAWFINKYESELLTNLLGYSLYKAFMEGIVVDPMDSKWSDLLYGAEYNYNGYTKYWKGIIQLPLGSSPSISNGGTQSVVVGRGHTYDPVANASTITIPPAFVGKNFTLSQRGVGQLRTDEFTVAGNTLTLTGSTFLSGDTYFYNASYSMEIAGIGEQPAKSMIANYVYYYWQRNEASQSSGLGEVATKTENSDRVSPDAKMVAAWNELSGWVAELICYLDATSLIYTDWNYIYRYDRLNDFRPINTLGI